MAFTLVSSRVLFEESSIPCVAPGWVRVEGPRIAAVGRGPAPSDAPKPIELRDRLIAPALVNAHTHCALSTLRGRVGGATAGNVVEDLFYRVEHALTPEDVRAFARMGAWESLLSGVGLVWDHYFFGAALAAGISDTGLAAVIAPTVQDLAGPSVDPRAPRGATPRWEQELEATETLALAGMPRVYAALGPHATDTVSPTLWREVGAMAERLGLPVHAHLAQSLEEVERAREVHGTTPFGLLERVGLLEHARGVFAHALFVDDAELARLGPAHALVACPYAQLLFGFPARVDHWEAAGVSWVVATDCAASNDSMQLRKELRLVAGMRTLPASFGDAYERFLAGRGDAASVQRARDASYARFEAAAAPAELYSRITSVPGALHPHVRAGVLAPGALANVVVYDVDHPTFWPAADVVGALVTSDVDAAIHAMWVAGQPIGEAGDFHRSIVRDERYRAHREEADARLAELLARTGVQA
ncbi:MAG: amidohydrolase family protein [Myxococcales bacterium]|nr:amidohydrolase family protein [Myxococcales bacterium]